MEREMEAVQQDLKSVESRYGDDVLHLVIACGCVSKLVKNREINAKSASTSTGFNPWRMRSKRSTRFDGTTMSIILTELSRASAPVNTLGKR